MEDHSGRVAPGGHSLSRSESAAAAPFLLGRGHRGGESRDSRGHTFQAADFQKLGLLVGFELFFQRGGIE